MVSRQRGRERVMELLREQRELTDTLNGLPHITQFDSTRAALEIELGNVRREIESIRNRGEIE